MGRIDAARETMRKLDWDDRALEASFPEFAAVKDNFTFGEVWQGGVLDTRQRLLVSAACLATVEGGDLEPVLDAALGQGVSPAELQEVFHQAAPSVGFARAERGLGVLEKLLKAHGVDLPLAPQATVTEEDRLEEGIAVQRSIFGPMIDAMRANAAPDQMFMQDALSAHCFGDTYTRGSLDLKTRELLTFVCIVSLGGCESQANSHAAGNLAVGNNPAVLASAVTQCLPYIGFPRTLNAMTAIGKALEMAAQAKGQSQGQDAEEQEICRYPSPSRPPTRSSRRR